MRMLLKIGEVSNTEAYLQEALVRKERIMDLDIVFIRLKTRVRPTCGKCRGNWVSVRRPRWYQMSLRIEAISKNTKG